MQVTVSVKRDRQERHAGSAGATLVRLARRGAPVLALVTGGVVAGARWHHRELQIVQPNANTKRAGVLHNGVLSVTLEAKQAAYQIDGPARPPIAIEAFAEPGQAPLLPGPLVRAPAGTQLHVSIHNTLMVPLTFFVPAAVHGGPDRFDAMDSLVLAPGSTGLLTTRATVPGNYVYRATTPAGGKWLRHMSGVLAGAMIIDSAGAAAQAHDRVFVIMEAFDSASTAYLDSSSPVRFNFLEARDVFTINGRSWPNTERLHATVGDSVHWRVLNATSFPHPMHLHGFYYRVDDYSGPETAVFGRPTAKEMVVTQFLPGFAAMSLTWSPDRPGNWLFHCHFAPHLRPDSISAAADDPHQRMMVGLALGTIVTPRAGVVATGDPAPVRHLRLVATAAIEDAAARWSFEGAAQFIDTVPTMHFVLEENGRRVDTHTDLSPELDLVRGEPVAITIVNHLPEPTSVHWHGMELEDSYMDGVPGFSGSGQRVTPEIAPGDSFTARFTPPRAGTFMYHAHVDEIREQMAGLEGALIVREPGPAASPNDDVFFFKEVGSSIRTIPGARAHRFEINGQSMPDTVVLRVGVPARLRLISLNSNFFAPTFALSREPLGASMPPADSLESWSLVAKDGFGSSPAARQPRAARQVVSVGETYDFEYTPHERGYLHLEVWNNPLIELSHRGHPLVVSVPIRVE